MLPINYKVKKSISDTVKKYLETTTQVDNKNVYHLLLNAIETLEAAKPGNENKDAYLALQQMAVIFKNRDIPAWSKSSNFRISNLFLNAMYSIAEVDHCLTNYLAVS